MNNVESHISIQYFQHAYAEFILGSYNNTLCLCDFRYRNMRNTVDRRVQQSLNANFVEQTSDVIEMTKVQLNDYFVGKRQNFDIPLVTAGSAFQKTVWHALQTIGYGTTVSYKQLAAAINNPDAVRAVGTANGANAIAIIIPCHRVIASDGTLGGYAGGLALKKRLLSLEEKARQYATTPNKK
jgi:methylated-DNA-[protein]-cysteine S-methyltransferase